MYPALPWQEKIAYTFSALGSYIGSVTYYDLYNSSTYCKFNILIYDFQNVLDILSIIKILLLLLILVF